MYERERNGSAASGNSFPRGKRVERKLRRSQEKPADAGFSDEQMVLFRFPKLVITILQKEEEGKA